MGKDKASQSYSQLYITRDGGISFTQLMLPMDAVTELPSIAKEYGFIVDDYDYMEMPQKEGDIIIIKVLMEADENEGIVFQSNDNGETWLYAGISQD